MALTFDASGLVFRMTRTPWSARSALWAPLIAGVAALAVWQLGLRGADVPAQTYYVEVFRSHGWVLWDNGWYAGHFQVSYSVLFPALGAMLGLYGAAFVCATTSAWAFARLAAGDAGSQPVPVLLYATGTVVAVAIGQLAFLAGLALALLALLAARRNHFLVALPLVACCSLFSEVAGVFLVLALSAWVITGQRADRRRLLFLSFAALAPMAAQSAFLPPLGSFPFAGVDLFVVEGVCILGVVFLPKQIKTLRFGLALYGASAVVVFLVPNPLGGNMARAVLYFAPALFAFLARIPGRRAFALLIVPLLIWQYVPASSSLLTDASAHSTYFEPLIDYLHHQHLLARLEIPFTSAHWETAYVAPHVPLARGWLRQLDVRDNPLFYQATSVDATSYHHWLLENGVAWVALPDVALDYSSVEEANLLKHGQPYLHPVWHSPHWRLWKVTDSPGLVSGPARVTSLEPDHVALQATSSGAALLRVHYTSTWTVTNGHACVLNHGGWTELVIRDRGPIDLTTSLIPKDDNCSNVNGR